MGNAPTSAKFGKFVTVHPHVHGERMTDRVTRFEICGSSPRTWGTRGSRRGISARRRFIPTYMGNADGRRWCPAGPPVHPHVHGERASVRLAPLRSAGSSPRTWGTPSDPRLRLFTHRFIPTYMGNAMAPFRGNTEHSVHPHVHGERPPPGKS